MKYFCTIAICLLAAPVWSQLRLDSISLKVDGEYSLAEVLMDLERTEPIKFFFQPEWLEPYSVGPGLDGTSLEYVLNYLLRGSDVTYQFHYGYALIFFKDRVADAARANIIRDATLRKKPIRSLVLGDRKGFKPGAELRVYGQLIDERSGRPLRDVTVRVDGESRALTDSLGKYQVMLLPGEHIMSFSLATYEENLIALTAYTDGEVNSALQVLPILLDEVIVSDQQAVNRRVGQTSLSMSALKRMPSMLGEADIIRQVQNQPGVTTIGEIASGFNVRGGGVDQNLVLYDGVPIFNTAHAFGFFPAFNAEAVGNVSFFRGGIPAEYGGRVSSVLDISGKEAPDQWHASGGVGMISAYVAAGGPLNDKTSVMGSARVSYSDWILQTIKSAYSGLSKSSVNFFDASLKISHKWNERSKITFSGYSSADRFSLVNDSVYHSANYAASIRYSLKLNQKIDLAAALDVGRYEYTLSQSFPTTAFDLGYSVTYPSFRLDAHIEGRHRIAMGVHNTYYSFDPGYLNPTTEESNASTIRIPSEQGLESAIYVSDGFNLSEKLFVDAGLRFSMFSSVGPGTVYSYAEGKPYAVQNVTDSVAYARGDIMNTYSGFEPRVSIRYILSDNSSIKLG